MNLHRIEIENKKRKELYEKKYLIEIINDDKPKFGNRNLILAPVGSGKSFLIENKLIPKDYTKKILYLTSTTALKDSLAPDNNKIRREMSEQNKSVRYFTSQNKNKYGSCKYEVHVLTYHEFGKRILSPNQTFTKHVGLIFCDEIHSLPKYFNYKNSIHLGTALRWLFSKHDNITKFYFTATNANLNDLEKKVPGYLDGVKTFNYLDHPKIRKYVANSTYYINNIKQLGPHLKARLKAFNYYGYKALAFTNFISEQKEIAQIAKSEGYKPIILWSINNETKMSKEQLRVREIILSTGMIPEPYNLLIINEAMQEGWNLYDDKVVFAVLNTLDITEQIQAVGRIRKDIDFVIKKQKDSELEFNQIELDKSYLNKELRTEDKLILCEELYILDRQGRLKKWPTVRTYIENSGYIIKDKTVKIDGKRVRVSTITIKD